ncbi:MAG: hypothetical protein ACRC8W_09280 [Plesiomonas shigelloides]
MNNKVSAADMIGILVNELDEWPKADCDTNSICLRAPIGWKWLVTPERAFPFITNGDSVIAKDAWLMAKAKKEMKAELIQAEEITAKHAATAIQPAPSGSGNPILGMVLADLTNRALEGKEKYGEPLKANNGRKPLWDAYQEALDLCMYLRQMIEEQKQ